MADAVLSVEITGKIDALRDAFKNAYKEIDSFEKRVNEKTLSIDKDFSEIAVSISNSTKKVSLTTSKATKEISSDFESTAKISRNASNDISQSLSKAAIISSRSGTSISKGSDQASFALTNLGRVAQDAPFGFIGIQNNLNPLLESFQRLQKETGSTGATLKALGSSLIGAGGLGLALSLASSAFLIYQQYQQKANKSTEDLTTSIFSYSKALNEASDNSAKEVANLSALYNASQNLNLPLATRKKLVKELQDQYPETFSNFKTEAILAGEAGRAYDSLSKSIINAAIVKVSKQNLEEQIKPYSELINKLESEQAKLDIINEENAKKAKEQGRSFVNATSNNRFIVDENGDLKNISDYQKALTDKIQVAQKALNNVIEKYGVGDLLKKDAKKASDASEEYSRIKINPVIIDKTDYGKAVTDATKPIIESIIKELDAGKTKPLIVPVPIQIEPVNPEVTGQFDLAFQKISEQVFNGADIIQNTLTPLIADSFAQLGEAFNSGDFSNIGKGFLSALTGLISSFGKITIQEGLFHLAKGLAYSLSPLTASLAPSEYAVGGGLVAAGGIASAVGGLVGSSGGSGQQGYQIPQFATGVTGFSGGLALVGERGPELVNLPTGSNVITNQNTKALINSNRSSAQVVIPDVKISGQDILLIFERANKFNGRR